eukprot:CAMPEP_0201584224 /NCGR_PEP_ID=MMETSP0190_2-20130828/107940_1 /ASSEMBLY_ACC=CAM_ASM_000263 /TAXON_ID=37353 /ORGANISM="Rosalina sp." /LENGTH=75 /DNA_ID=CAMNT_0048027779 /DNA_START=174 /DNA_END=398 /DNA_ORIENTATION=+
MTKVRDENSQKVKSYKNYKEYGELAAYSRSQETEICGNQRMGVCWYNFETIQKPEEQEQAVKVVSDGVGTKRVVK